MLFLLLLSLLLPFEYLVEEATTYPPPSFMLLTIADELPDSLLTATAISVLCFCAAEHREKEEKFKSALVSFRPH